MKKTIYLALSFLAFAGCTETTEKYEMPRPVAPALSVSTSKVLFEAGGGKKRVVVACDADDWAYEVAAPWAAVSREGNVLTITAPQNGTSEVLTSVVTVIARRDGYAAEQPIRLAQAAYTVRNLSADGTANCYIASTGSSYMLDASVKGNGNAQGDGTSGYIAACGVDIDLSRAAYADLLWESTFVFNRSSCAEIIEGAPLYDNGYIFFSTGSYEGNAVIGLRDSAGNILWSWHIWVCDDTMASSSANGYEFMDRNLGALNNEPSDVGNRGLLYQWGRKDPFLPSGTAYGAAESEYLPNEQVGDGSGKWIYEGQSPQPVNTAPGNIPLTVKNPMTFYGSYSNGVYTWYTAAKNSVSCNSGLWGDEQVADVKKSIFDPCPVGYRVPPVEAFGNVNLTETEYAAAWTTKDKFGRFWDGGNGDYFPYAGQIRIFTGHAETGSRSCYWTNTAEEEDVYTSTLYLAGGRAALFRTGHIYGCNVRCVKE